MLSLAAEKEKSEQLEARVNVLEQEVRNTLGKGIIVIFGGSWRCSLLYCGET